MDLTVKNYAKEIIRNIPAEKLDQDIFGEKFKYWIAGLLSLSEDKMQPLNNAIEAIKENSAGITPIEVIKVFKMYAKGDLNIEPISNHIDYILVGKIFNEYKKQRTRPKKKESIPEKVYTDQEKENLIFTGLVNCFDSYSQYKIIDDGYFWAGKYLGEKGLIKFTDEEREAMMKKAEINVKKNAKEEGYFAYKKLISQLERKKNSKIEVEYVYLGLAKFFDSLIKDGKHIKDII